MGQIIDNRGLACPQPVINTKKALDAMTAGVVVSIVDNVAARENVKRLVQSLGCSCTVEEQGDLFHLTITKNGGQEDHAAPVERSTVEIASRTALLVKSNLLGIGAEELGQVLMKSYFYTLTQTPEHLPATVIFLNTGVKLTIEGSPVLHHVRELAEQGVEILSCGTCLDFYGVKEQLAVGRISNMYEINEQLQAATKVISL